MNADSPKKVNVFSSFTMFYSLLAINTMLIVGGIRIGNLNEDLSFFSAIAIIMGTIVMFVYG